MKKKRFGLLFLLPFLLVGCRNSVASASSRESTSNTTSSATSSETLSETSSSTLSENEVIEPGKIYESTSWDDNLVKVIEYITGENNADLVPSVNADNYNYFLTIDETTSLDLAIIRCFGFNENIIVDLYETALLQNGFYLSSENPYGWMEISVTEDLVVQYEIREDLVGQTYFELLIYKVELRIAEWPKEAIEEITAEEIPVVEGSSYEVFLDFTIDYKARVTIYTYHTEMTDVKEYEDKLEVAGFTLNKSLFYSEAVSDLGTHIMYDFDSIEKTFVMYIYNDWPYLDINYYLGMDLPRLDDKNAVMDYTYVQHEDEYGNYEILTLYYDYVGTSCVSTYGKQLEAIGFIQVGEESTKIYNEGTKNQLTITSRDYVMNLDQEDEHWIGLMYCLEQESLAIAIYY